MTESKSSPGVVEMKAIRFPSSDQELLPAIACDIRQVVSAIFAVLDNSSARLISFASTSRPVRMIWLLCDFLMNEYQSGKLHWQFKYNPLSLPQEEETNIRQPKDVGRGFQL